MKLDLYFKLYTKIKSIYNNNPSVKWKIFLSVKKYIGEFLYELGILKQNSKVKRLTCLATSKKMFEQTKA